ncbi:transcription repressor OFP6 [Vigna radiata var. radiata]|uniref:Transcription repressor n=1 Tax=Vigna radiata var. radiata TaxID=3916 RepID=A0A1S3V3U8_VIGRR|nr:transcription repressor OFP6 [Vigna radiata var. radiata]
MSSSARKLTFNTVSVSLGCGTCRRPKLLRHIFHPKRRPKRPTFRAQTHHWSQDRDDTTTTATTSTTTTTTTFSPCHVDSSAQFCDYAKSVRGFGRVGSEGVAVEKDSDDPYLDFRHSMLQMILQNEIYSKDDLRELLNCFLQLNSPDHHGVIVRAFTEIWNGVFSVSSGATAFHRNRKTRDF